MIFETNGMPYFVLISTYWNVNIFQLAKQQVFYLVLISTYWNVNQIYADIEQNTSYRFNLNLLECKLLKNTAWDIKRASFNLNLLECK